MVIATFSYRSRNLIVGFAHGGILVMWLVSSANSIRYRQVNLITYGFYQILSSRLHIHTNDFKIPAAKHIGCCDYFLGRVIRFLRLSVKAMKGLSDLRDLANCKNDCKTGSNMFSCLDYSSEQQDSQSESRNNGACMSDHGELIRAQGSSTSSLMYPLLLDSARIQLPNVLFPAFFFF